MTQPTTPEAQAETTPAADPRRAYITPRLMVHGTVQTLTLGTTGVDGASGVDTRQRCVSDLETAMTELSAPSTQTQLAPVTPPQRVYTAPRLTIYGTVQRLTHGVGDINGVSGTPDGG